jgi:hypothetical protein
VAKSKLVKVRYILREPQEFVGKCTEKVYGLRNPLTVFYVLKEDAFCEDDRIIIA